MRHRTRIVCTTAPAFLFAQPFIHSKARWHTILQLKQSTTSLPYTTIVNGSSNRIRCRNARPQLSTSALTQIFSRHASNTTIDRANPPESTRPPSLKQPQRGEDSIFQHLWKTAKAYGTFYKTGIKAIFQNRRLAKELLQKHGFSGMKVEKWNTAQDRSRLAMAVREHGFSRADYQLLYRAQHDWTRVPLFSVLVVVLGEWLVLILPFMPSIQPFTCRLPGVMNGMRKKSENRRKEIFRLGIREPDQTKIAKVLLTSVPPTQDAISKEDNVANHTVADKFVRSLTKDQVYLISASLNLHSGTWEKVATRPPTELLQGRIVKRLCYITTDDILLAKAGGVRDLLPNEVITACEERGLDVLGRPEHELRSQLQAWLSRQVKTDFVGSALCQMLFRRPNAWP